MQVLGLRYTRIIYVESFARVKSLSLSGKILKGVVDCFIVQWPDAAGSNQLDSQLRVGREREFGLGGKADEGRNMGAGGAVRVKGSVRYLGWLV